MSWCCLALRSSAEQKGIGRARKWLKSLVCVHGAAIRSGKTSPKSQLAGARATGTPSTRWGSRPRISAPHANLGLAASSSCGWSCVPIARRLLATSLPASGAEPRERVTSRSTAPPSRSGVPPASGRTDSIAVRGCRRCGRPVRGRSARREAPRPRSGGSLPRRGEIR
jgi:hypothetical protein